METRRRIFGTLVTASFGATMLVGVPAAYAAGGGIQESPVNASAAESASTTGAAASDVTGAAPADAPAPDAQDASTAAISAVDAPSAPAADAAANAATLSFTVDELELTPRGHRYLTQYVAQDIPEGANVTFTIDNNQVATIDSAALLSTSGTGTATVSLLVDGAEQDTLTLRVADPAYNADYDTMMDRWITRVTGGPTLDVSDPDIKAYVAKISSEGEALWKELDTSPSRDRLWPKVDSDSVSADYTTQFKKIKQLAFAFGVKGSTLYHNADLLQDIVDAIDFMVTEKNYNGTYHTGNWWDWQIGCTQPLCDAMMVIYDYTDYSNLEPAVQAIEGYAQRPSKRFNGVTETGANRTDTGLAVLGSAIIARNDARMQMIPDEVPDVMKLVTSGDGYYADGSLVQHSNIAYMGAYGNQVLKGVGRINSIVADTAWEITDPRIENVYQAVMNGYIPLMHQGQQMAMVCGRSISRAPGKSDFSTEFWSGSQTIANVLLIAQAAPEPYKSAFNSAAKGWLESSAAWKSTFDYYANARDLEALVQAKAVMEDDSITASSWTGMKVYNSTNRVVQATDAYQAGLSMYSKWICNFEAAVGSGVENGRGWHTGDGMLYIYNDDLAQYDEGYWPTVDAARLPGTTVDTRDLSGISLSSLHDKSSPERKVGGATDGENGVACMAYNANGIGGMNVTAKKSWFFLPGQIVALGADIDGSTDASIETTVENRMMTSDENAITINGMAFAAAGDAAESMQLEDGAWAHLTGTGEGNDLGYYFIEGGNVDVARETRTGSYSDINGVFPSDTVYTKSYFKMGVNHGKTVQDGTYGYVILPGASKDQTAAYAQAPEVEVIRNDADVQAVRVADEGIVAMNVWNGTQEVAGLSVSAPCSVYMQNKDGELTIALSNPNRDGGQITLKLAFAHEGVVELGSGVTDNGDGSFTFATDGLAGASQTLVLKVGDKTALAELVAKAEALSEKDFTSESWAFVADALADAKQGLQQFAPAQAELDKLAGALQTALDGLKPATVTVVFDDGLPQTENQPIVLPWGASIDVSQVAVPTRDGWKFEGWFADEAGTTPFDPAAPVLADTTVYAKWSKLDDGSGADPDGGQGGQGTNPDGDGQGGQGGQDGDGTDPDGGQGDQGEQPGGPTGDDDGQDGNSGGSTPPAGSDHDDTAAGSAGALPSTGDPAALVGMMSGAGALAACAGAVALRRKKR